MTEQDPGLTPQPQEQATAPAPRSVSIGLPRCNSPFDQRFPLTPEGVALLTARGFSVRIERDAPAATRYPDRRFASNGAHIVSRSDAWNADIVIHAGPLSTADARQLRHASLLISFFHPDRQDPDSIRILQDHRVTAIALDLVRDPEGHAPIADISGEIEGRAALTLAAALMADPRRGKGILLGGVAGIVPCECLIIGSGITACAAAAAAIGLGAQVRLFDNDTYRLRRAIRRLGHAVSGSALHPPTVQHALASADVVIATPVDSPVWHGITTDMTPLLKHEAILIDLCGLNAPSFPSLPPAPFDHAAADIPGRTAVYVNPAAAVPRTAAMALSNALVPLLARIADAGSSINAIRQIPGLKHGITLFHGITVNPLIASIAGSRPIDINFLITLS